MERKRSGKRGSAIVVLMVVAAIAGSPSAATAASTPRPLVSLPAPAPVAAYVAPVTGFDRASWAEASWAGE
jgi:MFS-type transporter involved in bile tolerance (Atg22 family)